jgi:tetraacyldisaccharide 4'-kinase
MKTPSFWQQKTTLSTALLPIASLYETISILLRLKTAPVTLPIPVICIGGVTAGGAGKTPVALYFGSRMKSLGINAFYLTRGYGGSLTEATRVNREKHSASEVGDEPLLLANTLPTIKCADRLSGAKLALKLGAEAIIMDDGFQNPSLTKNLNVLVVDGRTAFGNGRLIPAGPLRERSANAINRSHMIVTVNRTTRIPPLPKDKPVFAATTYPKDAAMFKGKKLFAFCGLAYPEKFFEMLGAMGVKIIATKAFPDHHPYTRAELMEMIVVSTKEKAVLVTTAKDLVRVPQDLRDCMVALELGLEMDNALALDNIINFIMGREATAAPEAE